MIFSDRRSTVPVGKSQIFRIMSYRFHPSLSLGENVRLVAREQIDLAIEWCRNVDTRPASVSGIREACRKLRALVRLCAAAHESEPFNQEDKIFRDISRKLPDFLSLQKRLEIFDRLTARETDTARQAGYADIRHILSIHNQFTGSGRDLTKKLDAVRVEMIEARARLILWPLDQSGDEVIETGIAASYRKSKTAMKKTLRNGTPETLRAFRKALRYHRYHVQLIAPAWPEEFDARHDAARSLEDLLKEYGALHTLKGAVKRMSDIQAPHDTREALLVLADKRLGELVKHACAAGSTLFTCDTKRFARAAGAVWNKARLGADQAARSHPDWQNNRLSQCHPQS